MFRNRPIAFVLLVVLALPTFGLTLLVLLLWWAKCCGSTLVVTNVRTTLRRGILSKHTSDVHHTDVRNVQISQGLFQRLFSVGTIGVSSAGQSGLEISVSGIPAPSKVKEIIDNHRHGQS